MSSTSLNHTVFSRGAHHLVAASQLPPAPGEDIQPDKSTYVIRIVDPATGDLVRTVSLQGYPAPSGSPLPACNCQSVDWSRLLLTVGCVNTDS